MIRPVITALVSVTLIGVTGGALAAHRDEDAAVRAVLDSYLAMVTYPDPKPIDGAIFAADIEAFWSTGDTYRGREAVADAMAVGSAQIAADVESFSAVSEDVTIRRKGEVAWLTCRIEFSGKLNKDRGPVGHSVRSTFVFEKRDDRWRIVHEHSSRPPERK